MRGYWFNMGGGTPRPPSGGIIPTPVPTRVALVPILQYPVVNQWPTRPAFAQQTTYGSQITSVTYDAPEAAIRYRGGNTICYEAIGGSMLLETYPPQQALFSAVIGDEPYAFDPFIAAINNSEQFQNVNNPRSRQNRFLYSAYIIRFVYTVNFTPVDDDPFEYIKEPSVLNLDGTFIPNFSGDIIEGGDLGMAKFQKHYQNTGAPASRATPRFALLLNPRAELVGGDNWETPRLTDLDNAQFERYITPASGVAPNYEGISYNLDNTDFYLGTLGDYDYPVYQGFSNTGSYMIDHWNSAATIKNITWRNAGIVNEPLYVTYSLKAFVYPRYPVTYNSLVRYVAYDGSVLSWVNQP